MSLPTAARLSHDVPVPDDKQATVVLVAADGSEHVVEGLAGPRCDMRCVQALLRMQVQARRRGCRLRLRDVSDELLGLLELAGLADALGVEPRWQAERSEQLGVDEVVQPGDPPA